MVMTAVVNKADPRTTKGVVYPPTCIKKLLIIHSKLLMVQACSIQSNQFKNTIQIYNILYKIEPQYLSKSKF